MRSKLVLPLLASAVLAACSHQAGDNPSRGVDAVHTPVVSRTDFVFDAAAPSGMLAPEEAVRLDNWFRSMDLGYGDIIYIDGGYEGARSDVARIASQYGLMLAAGTPVTAGRVPDGAIRVVVSRTRASVPGCPDWDHASHPNYEGEQLPNFGCGVNANLAAQVANPTDLVHGRESGAVVDARTAAKAIDMYRTAPPTGKDGLQDIATRKAPGGK